MRAGLNFGGDVASMLRSGIYCLQHNAFVLRISQSLVHHTFKLKLAHCFNSALLSSRNDYDAKRLTQREEISKVEVSSSLFHAL